MSKQRVTGLDLATALSIIGMIIVNYKIALGAEGGLLIFCTIIRCFCLSPLLLFAHRVGCCSEALHLSWFARSGCCSNSTIKRGGIHLLKSILISGRQAAL